jgi:transposase
MKLSWDEVHGIMERAVKRGLRRRAQEPVAYLGVNEKAFPKGHKYFTLVNDLERGRVLDIAGNRTQASLGGFWPTLNEAQRTGIRAIAMDMWDPYVRPVRENLEGGTGLIVFDKFHIAKHLGDAVDRVRHQEHKTPKAAGDDRLKGTRYDWLRHPAGMEAKDRREFQALRDSSLKTARAWALKASAMALFEYHYERPARKHFRWWHGWAVRSRFKPLVEVAGLLKRRFENIITYLRHRITNAASESINAKIQWVKYIARGFRNKQNFQTAMYFHCGGLDLSATH